jgi:glutathione-independent formaldehyde dehydrogenase
MKALVYHGPKKVSVDKVPDAKLEKLTDVVIKLTTTNICPTFSRPAGMPRGW